MTACTTCGREIVFGGRGCGCVVEKPRTCPSTDELLPGDVEQLRAIWRYPGTFAGDLISKWNEKRLRERGLVMRDDEGDAQITERGRAWLMMAGLIPQEDE